MILIRIDGTEACKSPGFDLDRFGAPRLQAIWNSLKKSGAQMNNMNFFSWLRNGVRQSVLLGVSDAVEQLGTAPSDEELNPQVRGFLQLNSTDIKSLAGPAGGSKKSSGGRKRLGKSLKEIGAEKDG